MLIYRTKVKEFALEYGKTPGAQVHQGWQGLLHQVRGQPQVIHS